MPKRKTHNQFIKEIKELNPNIKILGEYINNRTKIKYQCECGNITHSIPYSLLQGRLCKKCGTKKIAQITRKPQNTFIKELHKINSKIKILSKYQNINSKIKYQCECGNITESSPKLLLNGHKCMKCADKRRKITKQKIYNDNNYCNTKKIKQTKKEKYGDSNYCNHKKAKQTNLKKYGVSSTLQLKEVQNKIKKTNLKKYGTEYPIKCQDIKDKIIKTCLKRYGVPYGVLNGNKYYSKISQELFWIIYNKLPENLQQKTCFAELNQEFGKNKNGKYYFYDFVISSIKTCIEFNGNYWHKKPCVKDKEKIKILTDSNFKVLTIWENEYRNNKELIIQQCLNYINNRLK